MDYVAIIHKGPESDFGVSFPDFPGCITAGRTLDEAKALALEALTGHIGVMREAGEPVPAPSTLDKVPVNTPRARALASSSVRLAVMQPGKSGKLTPKSLSGPL